MTSESLVLGRRNTVLATVIGTVLATYAGSATALEFEFDNGARLNWNTTLSVGASWRAEDPSRLLYTVPTAHCSAATRGRCRSARRLRRRTASPATRPPSSANLNYDSGDMFGMPFKLLSDVELKKGNFGGLVRIKAWYDYAQNENKVNVGNQANNYNGARPGLGPYATGPYGPCTPATPAGVPCLPYSSPGNNNWPKETLSDSGFEDEQQFDNLMLLDAYVYGSFDVGDTNLQLRLGNQVVNWGESVFIQGVNQINPIDVPAARRAGAELKEILLPVWMAYANWGFNFGSVEAFYQFQWNNTSVDGCGTYWATVETIISTSPGKCNSATVITSVLGGAAPGTTTPLIGQLGSNPFAQGNGLYVPLVKGKEPSDSGQFGFAFRFPVDKIDTEFGLYFMNIHSRLPIISGVAGTLPTTPLVLPPGALSPPQTTPYRASRRCDPADRPNPFWRIPGTGAEPARPERRHGAARRHAAARRARRPARPLDHPGHARSGSTRRTSRSSA